MAIKLKDIITAPWNTRGEITPESVAELAASIKEQGLINPITIWRGDGGAWYCIAGNRRLAALNMLNLEGGEFYTEFNGTEHEAKMVTVTENLQREDVGIIEEAALVEQCLEDGMTANDIAAKTGRPLSWVNRRKKLIALGEEWKAAASRFKPFALEMIASYPADVQARVAKSMSPATASMDSIRYALEREHRNLATAKFDTKLCAACPKRTGAEADLFGICDDSLGCCMDCKCFERKDEERVNAEIAKATGKDTEVVRVKFEWQMPREDETSTKRTKDHPCAYVTKSYDGDIVIRWGESKKEKDAREKREDEANAAEREAERAERARAVAICDKFDEWKDAVDADGWPEGACEIVRECILADLAADDWISECVRDSITGWHSNEEWAGILRAFPKFAALAGVSEDDATYLLQRYENENENE